MRGRRGVVVIGAVLAAAIAVAIVVLAVHKNSGPSSFLYSDTDTVFYVHWDHSGVGTLWATYVDPSNHFQVSSQSRQVSVTVQGSALSIEVPGDPAPVLGHRDGSELILTLDGSASFGGWLGERNFSHGSLSEYETAVGKVQLRGTAIASDASAYASQDPIDANAQQTTITSGGECLLYLSGTDVCVVMRTEDSEPSCFGVATQFGDLGSGGSWGSSPSGQNYPGQATLVCQYADTHARTFVTVTDAGFQQYGVYICSNISSTSDWFALR
jgi:hypothetical protein